MSSINLFQVSLEMWGCLICVGVGIVYGNKVHKIGGALKYLWLMLLINGLMLSCDATAYVFQGDTRSSGVYMAQISNFGLFFTEGVLTFYYVAMVQTLITGQKRFSLKDKWVKFCLGCIALQLLGTLATPFTGLYYSFSEMNNYQREIGIILPFGALGIAFVISSFQLLRRKTASTYNLWGTTCFSVLIFLVCFLVQVGNYGLSLINVGITVASLLLFVNLWHDIQNKVHQRKIEALEQIIHELLESREDRK